MATAETLRYLCLLDATQLAALLAQPQKNHSRRARWLTVLPTGYGAGDDPAREDDFQLRSEKLNKLSGTDTGVPCLLLSALVALQPAHEMVLYR